MRSMFLVIVLVVLFVATPAFADEDFEGVPKLQVRGEAVIEVPADELRLSIGVSSSGKTAEQALQQNSQALRQVEQALVEAGLEKGEYSTGRFDLQPSWSTRPRNVEPDWRPEIVGYRVQNSLQIKSTKLGLAGQWIEAASRAGANEIGQLMFGLANSDKHREAAIQSATEHARSDAMALADAAKVKLVRILELQLDPAGQAPLVRMASQPMVRSMAAELAPPIVAPDDLQIRAGVSITWQIAE
ncbi:MAG TPA: SIMPL domain-containing protein [Geothermobacteraceae bacterium]|nr:SIMPL domain-containing protein [Geothermobacteraceae bacterium]